MNFISLKLYCLISILFSYAASAAFYPINGGMIIQHSRITASSGTTTLAVTSNQWQVVSGTAAQTITIPDATLLPIDWFYEIVNNSTGDVTVKNFSGSTLATLGNGDTGRFILQTRATSAGVWTYISLSAAPVAGDAAGITQLTGDVTAGPGVNSQTATVAFVGGKTAAAVATSVDDTLAATALNTVSTIVKRNGSGNFAAGTITASLTGNVTGNADTATALAANPTDCSANQYANASVANGDLTCSQVAFSQLSGSASVAQSTIANQALTTCSTARTVDWTTGNSFTLTLTNGSDCAVTFSGAASGQVITIDFAQAGSGGGTATVSFVSTVNWPGGINYVATTGNAATDSCTFKYNGTDYRSVCQMGFAP